MFQVHSKGIQFYIYIYFFQILFYYRKRIDVDCNSSLCCTVGPPFLPLSFCVCDRHEGPDKLPSKVLLTRGPALSYVYHVHT